MRIISGTIKEKNGIDIFKLNPIEEAENTFQPAIFIHAINDQLINLQHTIDIFNSYGGEKSLKCSEIGGHNSKRPKRLVKEVGDFFEKYLGNNNSELEITLKENKNDYVIDSSILNQSFIFKTGEYNKDRERYNDLKEENEKKNMDDIKKILLNIKEINISKQSTEFNSNI